MITTEDNFADRQAELERGSVEKDSNTTPSNDIFFKDENFTLYCGDFREIIPNLNTEHYEMLLTDIPYDVINRDSNGLRNLDKKDADEIDFTIEDLLKTIRVINGSAYIFCGTEQVSDIRAGMVQKGLSTRLGIWKKTNPSPMNGQHIWLSGIECCVYGKKKGATFNEHCKNSVWEFPTGRKYSKDHPTPKSLPLFEYLIKASSNEGDTIIDICIGSGTTAVACKKLNRKCIGIELSPEYCEIAKQRYLNETNQAKLL